MTSGKHPRTRRPRKRGVVVVSETSFRGSPKRTRQLLRAAVDAGARVTRTKRHWIVWPRNGQPPIVVALTPSDHRADANTRARLRRVGIDV